MSNEEEIIAAADREINCLNKQIEHLQEQLNEANKLIKDFHGMHEFNKSVIEYLKKWGVK